MKKINYEKQGYLILGINGWIESSHDASATLIEVTKESCRIIAAIEEEKVIGIKCAYDRLPIHSIRQILDLASLIPDDIDEIVFGWDYPQLYRQLNKEFPFSSDYELLKVLFPDSNLRRQIPVHYINHHLSHASSVYRTSNFDEALIVVVDGNGENESCSVWTGKLGEIKCIGTTSIDSSFGFLYEATNIMLRFNVNESGKTMGLAAYGKPEYKDILLDYYINDGMQVNDEFQKLCNAVRKISNESDMVAFNCQEILIKTWLIIFADKLKLRAINKKPDSFYDCEEKFKNLAASIQTILEEKVTREIKKWIKITGIKNVCIAGGVGLNCTMNGKILAIDDIEEIFVQPASGDAGVSLGSALERARQIGMKSKITHAFSAYLGIELEDHEIVEYLKSENVRYKYVEDAGSYIADRICEGEIIALFQGRNEWGPRALGNRSIVSRPNEGKLDVINQNIKHRELGRPLAPSMLVEDACVLNNHVKSYCEYMNVAYKAEKKEKDFASILHIDNTYRPQYVSQKANSLYFQQLRQIKKNLGNSIVINTSLNNTTPIVYGVNQALNLFSQESLAAMVLNNRIILERESLKQESRGHPKKEEHSKQTT